MTSTKPSFANSDEYMMMNDLCTWLLDDNFFSLYHNFCDITLTVFYNFYYSKNMKCVSTVLFIDGAVEIFKSLSIIFSSDNKAFVRRRLNHSLDYHGLICRFLAGKLVRYFCIVSSVQMRADTDDYKVWGKLREASGLALILAMASDFKIRSVNWLSW